MPDLALTTPRGRGAKWLFVALGFLVVIAILGAVVAPNLKSPEQAAAEAAPPARQPVFVPLENRELAERIAFRAVVRPGVGITLTPTPALIAMTPVLTDVFVKPGASVSDGSVLFEVNGEPVFGMSWPFRAYRDIVDGDSGPDVRALQDTLAHLGYATSSQGVFDGLTQLGLTQFYADSGYQVPKRPKASAEGAGTGTGTSPVKPATKVEDDKGDASAADAAEPVVQLPYLRAAHVVRLPGASHTVTSVGISIGKDVSDVELALMVLDAGATRAMAAVTPDQAKKLIPGTAVELKDARNNSTVKATVSSVAKESTEVSGIGLGHELAMTFDGQELPPTDADLTIMAAAQAGGGTGKVLAAPISAVYARADGSSFLRKKGVDGGTQEVPVTIGLVLGGWAAITPTTPGGLEAGDQVAVGEV